MIELNDFESTTFPKHFSPAVKSAIFAKRCIKCDKVFYANYKFNDYECFKCREADMTKLEIKQRN